MTPKSPHWRLKSALLVAAAVAQLSAQTTFHYYYDANHQLIRVVDSANNSVQYEYDPAGNPSKIVRTSVSPTAPAIFNIVPSLGSAGQDITIYGQDFDATAAGDTVQFNGLAATVISASATALVVEVPANVTSGPVTLTINGTTVSSGALTFTAAAIPVITSISEPFGFPGQTLTGVVVAGANLTGATFVSNGATVSGVVINSNTQATLNLTLGPDPGYYALVAQTAAGASPAVIGANNALFVYRPQGDNVSFSQISVFNAYVPPGVDPLVPTGSNMAYADPVSVFNGYVPPGVDPLAPTGSNQAFELISYDNTCTTNCPAALPSLRVHPVLSTRVVPARTGAAAPAQSSTSRNTLIAGQTIPVEVAPGRPFTRFLEFDVNGVPLVSTDNGVLKTLFTVPYSVTALALQSSAHADLGDPKTSVPQLYAVESDPGRTIAGRVSDAAGRPIPGAPVIWHANGLSADFFAINEPLDSLPNLEGRRPSRTAYVSALNFPNPAQVFGKDPIGAQTGETYAARFHGKVMIDADGEYQFMLRAHAAARLAIDGQVVVETASTGGEPRDASAIVSLSAGAHRIEAIYYESQGASALQLFWSRPGSPVAIVPPAVLLTDASPAPAAIAAADGTFRLRVPAYLDGVQLELATGDGRITPDEDIAP